MSRLSDASDVRRTVLRALAAAAISAASPRAAVRDFLSKSQAQEPAGAPLFVVALGKAAVAMAAGALDALPGAAGLLISTEDALEGATAEVADVFQMFAGDHPVPGPRSLAAGVQLLAAVTSLSPDARVLCLLSGGASALCEVPIASVSLDELQAMNRALLASGLPIDVVNAARTSVSELKGGHLRALLGERKVVTLVVSDVPSDDPTVIASGLMDAPGESLRERLDRLERHSVFPALPRSVQQAILEDEGLPRSQPASQVLVSGRLVAEALAREAEARGLSVTVEGPLEGEARLRGEELALRDLSVECTVFFGETTVTLGPEVHDAGGRGGRNQELALAFASKLPVHSPRMLLALATDGVDGTTVSAGAIVDSDTCARGVAQGLAPLRSLDIHDAGTFLEASGDALRLPRTGTNVADLTVILR